MVLLMQYIGRTRSHCPICHVRIRHRPSLAWSVLADDWTCPDMAQSRRRLHEEDQQLDSTASAADSHHASHLIPQTRNLDFFIVRRVSRLGTGPVKHSFDIFISQDSPSSSMAATKPSGERKSSSQMTVGPLDAPLWCSTIRIVVCLLRWVHVHGRSRGMK
jgi:hypothetical protein